MTLTGSANSFNPFTTAISRVTNQLSLFNMPILGTYEYVTLISVVIISFGFAHTMIVKGHVAVDFVMRRFSSRVQAVVEIFVNLLLLGVLGMVAWRLAQFGFHNYENHLATETVGIPLYPFNYMISFGFFLLLFVLVCDLFKSIAKAVKR